MKILQINVRVDSGSVGRIVQDLYKGIKNEGHECKIAYARGSIGSMPSEDTIRICSELEVKKHALLTRLFGGTAFYSHRSTVKFLKLVDEFKPDIVHIHGVYGYYINMKDLFEYLQKNNIKVISTLHSCWDFTGHCCYFDFVGCEQWKDNCAKCPQKRSYPKSSFLDNTKRNFERKKLLYDGLQNCTIVTPSEWLADLARQSFLGKHRIITIENGVDTDVFKKKKVESIGYGIDIHKPIILCVANIWSERKGLKDVKELAEMLSERGENIQLVVVGVTDAEKDMIGNKAVLISRTTDIDELAKLYNAATVLFNPTYEDNYPTVNLEAIACGTPVITYNTGGSPEAIKKYNMGKVIEKRDFMELVYTTLHYYSADKENVDYEKDISFSRMMDEYMKVYKSV